jgi:hypothetical protein
MGGMLAATFLAIFFVPLFFKLLTDRKLRETRSTAELRAEADRCRLAAEKKAQEIAKGEHHE